MKKWMAMILAFLMLTLSGCGAVIPGISGGPGQNGGGTVVDFDPENPPKIDYDAPALSVTVNMVTELTFTLSLCNQILEAKALNAEGETLLSGLELTGQAYHTAMAAILEQAKTQGVLEDGTAVAISAQELLEGVWNLASYRILLRPFEAFGEKAGITLNCELTPAVELAWEIAKTHTNSSDEYDEVIWYNSGNKQILNRYFYKNGDYAEHYYLSSGGSARWEKDGKFTCYGNLNGVSFSYTLYPDGTRSTDTIVSNVDGQRVWSFHVSQDGATDEAFYQNGTITYNIYIFADGSYWEYFYEDGEVVRHIQSWSDGYTIEYFYENGEVVREVVTDSEGSTSEREPNQGEGHPAVTAPPETAPFDN